MSFFPKISAARLRSKRRTGYPSVTFGHVSKGRLASLSWTFQTGFMASVKRSDRFEKPVRRKFQHGPMPARGRDSGSQKVISNENKRQLLAFGCAE